MRAYLAIKYHPGGENRARIEAISAALRQAGVEPVCIARDLERWGEVHFDPPELMRQSFRALEACDLVVVELSEKGVGLGIEAGYAYARNIPIVTIAREGADISATLRGISAAVYEYRDPPDLIPWFEALPIVPTPD